MIESVTIISYLAFTIVKVKTTIISDQKYELHSCIRCSATLFHKSALLAALLGTAVNL